jgi:glucosamine--fructose-6-phosphate aminotransferase (isomerizing)
MCGVVGAILRDQPALEGILDGLRVLEYRGYDSAGVAVALPEGVAIRRRTGRIEALSEALGDGALGEGRCGVGHTRWATHGPPTELNAHPHSDASGRIALVHNGIVENHRELRKGLEEDGVVFRSETDTEVIVHLVARELVRLEDAGEAASLADGVRAALRWVEGYYAIAVLRTGAEPELVAARQGPPLCIAVTDEGAWLASDVLALLPHSRSVVFLEDGDVARLEPGHYEVFDHAGEQVQRVPEEIAWCAEDADLGDYQHYMQKEIHEQPAVLARTVAARVTAGDAELGAGWSDAVLRSVERVQILGCGTALHAGLVAQFLIEGLAEVPAESDYASEFRYREPRMVADTLALAISQSGETADTLAALRLAGSLGCRTGAICNVQGSTLVREAQSVLLTDAGPEIGVASTKAFTAQVAGAYLVAVRLGRARGVISEGQADALLEELRGVRAGLEELLREDSVRRVQAIARAHQDAKGFLFLGRGVNYPVALEGALKLKEISYVHAEGYPAGEMKHGPIALIEPGMTVLVVNSTGGVAGKVRANLEQVKARGGRVIAVGSDEESLDLADEAIRVPETSEWVSPILNVVPLQLFAYEIGLLKGCDIDKPRNLAKSVTVE